MDVDDSNMCDTCSSDGSMSNPCSTDTSSCASDPMEEDTADSAARALAGAPAPTWVWDDVPRIPGFDTPDLLPMGGARAQQLPTLPCPHSVGVSLRSLPGPLSARHYSYLLADNIDGRTTARKENAKTVHVRRAIQRAGLAVAACLPQADLCAPTCDSDDDGDWDVEDRDIDVYTIEAALAGLDASMVAASTSPDNHLRDGPAPYTLTTAMPPPTHEAPTYQCRDHDEVEVLKAAIKIGKSSDAAQQPPPANQQTQVLTLRRGQGVPLQAVLCVLQEQGTNATQPEQLHVIDVGWVPPFVPMPQPPTITETIQLTGLNRKQALVFAYLTKRITDRHIAKGISDPDLRELPKKQLLLLFLGGPGTGKTHVVKTLQWYAYQHEIHKAIAVTAYAWKAAILLQTPHTPACSTSSFFHVDSWQNNGIRYTPKYVGMRADGQGEGRASG